MKCRLCGLNEFNQIYKHHNDSVIRCQNCGFGTLHPLPLKEVLEQIYDDQDYHDDKTQSDHIADTKRKLKIVNSQVKLPAKILDYGCGTGNFIKQAKGLGYDVYGFDISHNSAKSASEFSGCPVKSGAINAATFPKTHFDLITSFDVIEHIEDFKQVILFWHKWLKPKGLLIISTPDLSSWDHRLFKEKWFGFTKIPQHINYFDRDSILKVLEKSGFEVLNIQTCGFVRSISFILDKLHMKKSLGHLLDIFKFDRKTLYLPMIDMLVIARKNDE